MSLLLLLCTYSRKNTALMVTVLFFFICLRTVITSFWLYTFSLLIVCRNRVFKSFALLKTQHYPDHCLVHTLAPVSHHSSYKCLTCSHNGFIITHTLNTRQQSTKAPHHFKMTCSRQWLNTGVAGQHFNHFASGLSTSTVVFWWHSVLQYGSSVIIV